MNLRMIYRYFLLSVCVVYSIKVYAQKSMHRYEMELGTMKADGFYKVPLVPGITGRCANPLRTDLRVWQNGQQIPYLLDNGIIMPQRTLDLPLMEAARDTGGQFYVIIENAGQVLVDNLTIGFENTDAVRSLTLSGSDDNKTWYAIREDFYWEHSASTSAGILSCPAVHYRYLRLVFNGSGKLPVKVLHAKTTTPERSIKPYMVLPDPLITRQDTNKVTNIRLKLGRRYLVSKVELSVSGPRYFRRWAELGTPDFSDALNNSPVVILSSGTQTIELDAPPTDEINIRIKNDDNPPVHIDAIRVFQDAQYLIAYLEKGKAYHLTFGDSTAAAPVYDLTYFKDSIGKQIPELSIGEIKEVKPGTAMKQPKSIDNKWLLWPLLVLLLAGLTFVTFKMVRKIGTTV